MLTAVGLQGARVPVEFAAGAVMPALVAAMCEDRHPLLCGAYFGLVWNAIAGVAAGITAGQEQFTVVLRGPAKKPQLIDSKIWRDNRGKVLLAI